MSGRVLPLSSTTCPRFSVNRRDCSGIADCGTLFLASVIEAKRSKPNSEHRDFFIDGSLEYKRATLSQAQNYKNIFTLPTNQKKRIMNT